MKWPVTSIGKLCVPTGQRDPTASPDSLFRYIDIASLDKDAKRITAAAEIRGSEAPSRARKEVRAGDVLVSTVRPNLNAVALVPDELDGQIASTGFCVLRADRKIAESKFIFYRCLTPEFVNCLVSQMRGANYPAVSDGVVKGAEIPAPAPREQRRIVELLEEADRLRRQRTEADKLASDILPTVFHKMFGEALTNPKNWPVVPLGKLIEEPQFGVSVALSDKTERKDGQLPVLRIANITKDGYLDTSDLRFDNVSERKKKELLLQKGDLLFNWRNSPNLVGKTAIFDADGDYIFASFLFRLKTRPLEAEVPYVWFFLNYLRKQGWFETKCRQAVSQANFGREELCAIPIPKPPLALQKPFTACYDSFHRLKNLRSQSGDQLERLFKILMHHAFTGELTAKWREAHLKELLTEMEHQARLLRIPSENN